MKSGHYDEARLISKESIFFFSYSFSFLLCIVYRMYPYNISVVSDLCLVEERAVRFVSFCIICNYMVMIMVIIREMLNPSTSIPVFSSE